MQEDLLFIRLMLVDFILLLLKSLKVILYPCLSLAHGGVPVAPLLSREYSCYVLQVIVLSLGLSSGFAKVSVIPKLPTQQLSPKEQRKLGAEGTD